MVFDLKPITVSLLVIASTPLWAQSVNVVVDQQGAQVSETINSGQAPAFVPDLTTLTFLGDNAPNLDLPASEYDWSAQVGQNVRVESRLRDLSYEGKLREVDGNLFTLVTRQGTFTLPSSDFYLVSSAHKAPIRIPYNGPITYRTHDLSWQPQRNIIINGNRLDIREAALVTNRSASQVTLANAMLREGVAAPAPMQRFALADASTKEASFIHGETVYNLEDTTIAAYSTKLIQLSQQDYQIEERRFAATLHGWDNHQGIELNFAETATFTPTQNHPAGRYQTLWQTERNLIPGDSLQFGALHKHQAVTIQLNNSQDISAEARLVTAQKNGNRIVQTWEIEMKNHTRYQQKYQIDHFANGVIESFSPTWINQMNARALQLAGTLAANARHHIRYKVEITQ